MARARAAEEAEELPEADRLEGFPHPRETQVLYGHGAVEALLAAAVAGGRLHHAWLLAGREGIGKATIAYRLARYVLAQPHERLGEGATLDVAADSIAARQVRALTHPGLLVLRRPYDFRSKRLATAITVDEVRRLRGFLGLTSGDNAWRVVLVDSADDLNINAANALLKSLEEPPRRTLFLLISSEPSALLATIRSRCRRLDFSPLPADVLQAAVTAALAAAEMPAPKPQQWADLVRLSEGSVRRALQLAAVGGLELNERIAALLGGLPNVDWPAVHALADQLGFGQDQRFEAFYDLLLDLIARLVQARAQGATGPEQALAQQMIGEGRLAQWAELWETVLREKNDAVLLNLDRKALILGTFARLEAAARR